MMSQPIWGRPTGPTSLRLLVVVSLASVSSVALADGNLALSTAYYKEKATRVIQPMLDGEFDVADTGTLQTHALIDAITSASVASGADGTPFTEKRYEAGAAYTHELEHLRIGGSARYSFEPDYKSMFAGARGELDLAQRNTTFGLGVNLGHDEIGKNTQGGGISSEGTFSESLQTMIASFSIRQLVSPTMVVGGFYDASYLSGFQANAYRRVTAGMSNPASERVPETRLRHALATRLQKFFPATNSTLIAGYRFYADDWGIVAHSPYASLIQQIGSGTDLGLEYRYHAQTAADFFQEVYDRAEEFLTDDPKLGAMHTNKFGVHLVTPLRLFGVSSSKSDIRLDFLLEYMTQSTRHGNAVIGQFAVLYPFEY